MTLDLIQKQTNFIMKIIMAEQIVSLNEKIRVCPRGTTTLTIASVPSVPSTDPTTPVVTQIPTVISGTFSIKRI